MGPGLYIACIHLSSWSLGHYYKLEDVIGGETLRVLMSSPFLTKCRQVALFSTQKRYVCKCPFAYNIAHTYVSEPIGLSRLCCMNLLNMHVCVIAIFISLE